MRHVTDDFCVWDHDPLFEDPPMRLDQRRPQARLIVREAIADAWAAVYGGDTRASAQRAARIVEDAVDRLDALYGHPGHATEPMEPMEPMEPTESTESTERPTEQTDAVSPRS